MKKNILFLICLFFLHLSCKRSNQEIKLDDYEIIKIAIKEEVTPAGASVSLVPITIKYEQKI